MRWTIVAILGFLAIASQQTVSSEDIAELPFDLDLEELANSEEFAEDEKLLREIEAKNSVRDVDRENEIASKLNSEALQSHILSPVAEIDPCEKMHCGAGRICQTKGEVAECVCIPDCPEETDKRRHVCTNKNETWTSDCAVYQQRCLCTAKEEGCLNPENTHLHIDYYGQCRKLETCSEEDMKDFPRRMRDWLFNVMRDLAERDELTEHYMQMEIEAETNMTRRWSNAAVWKWCDLDGDTDRSVSRHELFPIRAPLVSLEHCIAPFLESCDADNDHRVSLVEWGGCLELELDDLNERCDDIHKTVPQLLG